MAKAKKLPSGQWRTLVYSHTDEQGKRKYESFTADTRKESEYLAAEFALNKKSKPRCQLTFKEARLKYIESKNHILSPSSINGYMQMNTYFTMIDDLRLAKIDQELIQKWANEFSKTHAPKTVRNAHGLISSVLREYQPEMQLQTTLPQKIKPTYYVPSDSEISKLIDYLKDNDTEMLKAVYLAAFGTLRRSEICALTSTDISGNTVHVNKAKVKNISREFEVKTTKTVSSDRFICLPDFVIALLPEDGEVVSLTPDAITHRFKKTLDKLELHPFRFHDLRHYSASIMHAIGIPDQYIMSRGGWSSDSVLKQVYRGTLDEYSRHFTDLTNNYFNNMQHEMQHKNKKA